MPLRTIARITALRPGQSPPPVRTPNRMRRATYIQVLTLLLCGLWAVGCSSDADDHTTGTTLSVYMSLPREGVSARRPMDVAAGARLALSDAHGRADGKRVRLVQLDSSEPGDQ